MLHESKLVIMGDMKTPDFDDLLAAFDIPDMVDPKAAIESGHDEHDHMKQNSQGEDDTHIPSSSDVGVSVIVKNIRNVDSSEPSEKDHHHSTGNGLHNGFLTISNLERFNKEGLKSLKDKAIASGAIHKETVFNQFSPISSAEEFDDDEKIEVDDPPDREALCPSFGSSILTPHHYERDKAVEHLIKSGTAISNNLEKSKESKQDYDVSSVFDTFKIKKIEEKLEEGAQKMAESKAIDGKLDLEKSEVNGGNEAQLKLKSSAKLSSCIAAIAALSAKKAVCDPKDIQTIPEESSQVPKEIDNPLASLKSSEAQLTMQNLIDGTKRTPVKPSDSPRSVSSENSSKGSPSSGGSIPAIPKVRIKTIKTSSGEIKRTVTRVLPDLEADGTKPVSEQTSPLVVSSILSSSTSAATILSSPTRASLQTTVATNAVVSTDGAPKHVTIKPVATAFLPVSAVKTAGSQVINLKFGNNTTVKATVISAASVQSASNAIIKAANAMQQQTVVVPASSLASAKLVPKTVHFANLNLLPQGSQASSELRQVLTKPQQQIKQTLIPATAVSVPKKVSRVQVVASSQSSVVEAFNKVLSSINPIPVYVPNLSPPTNAGINLPARGYKCLECGDAFALEKSLLQHYDRRSVRIEVTCNHCAKNLFFYNKCSLLSHARSHKEKGVVMQCSHLILKPVPVDQMITSPQNSTPAATTATPRQTQAITVVHSVSKVQAAASGAVISASASAPITPAMPLDEDSSKLCRHSLKCLKCNEVFTDETSLATHYQRAMDATGQVRYLKSLVLC